VRFLRFGTRSIFSCYYALFLKFCLPGYAWHIRLSEIYIFSTFVWKCVCALSFGIDIIYTTTFYRFFICSYSSLVNQVCFWQNQMISSSDSCSDNDDSSLTSFIILNYLWIKKSYIAKILLDDLKRKLNGQGVKQEWNQLRLLVLI